VAGTARQPAAGDPAGYPLRRRSPPLLLRPPAFVAALLAGDRPAILGETAVGLEQYVEEILASGFPGIRGTAGRTRRALLDGYLDRIVERDVP
jgi:uncharacterized protein